MGGKKLFIANFSYGAFGQDFFLDSFLSCLTKKKYEITLIQPKIANFRKPKKSLAAISLSLKGISEKEDYYTLHKSKTRVVRAYKAFNEALINYAEKNCKSKTFLILNGYELCYNLDKLENLFGRVFVVMHYIGHMPYLESIYSGTINKSGTYLNFTQRALGSAIKYLDIKKEYLEKIIYSLINCSFFSTVSPILGSSLSFYIRCMRKLSSSSCKKIVPTPPMKKSLSQIMKEEQIIVMHWPYISRKMQHCKKIRSQTKTYTYLGRIVPHKGIEYLIESIKMLEKEGLSDIRLNICGAATEKDSRYFRWLKQRASGLCKIKVIFHGYVSGYKKERILEETDYLVLPSYYEPFGYVLLEAIDKGKMLVISDTEGPLSIADNDCAYIADFNNPEKRANTLYEAIKRSYFSSKRLSPKKREAILSRYYREISPEDWG